ncbi:MAG: choice-of-anchor Q domain-containing protein [Rudaea sp.]
MTPGEFAPCARRVVARFLHFGTLAWACALSLFALSSLADAQVTTTADAGVGSLRSVIAAAAPGATITFDPSLYGSTITLTSGEIAIAKTLTIQGPGATQLTISGGNASRIFDLTDGTATLTLSGLTLANGNAGGGRGGAVASQGALVVDGVQFQANQAGDGGGALSVSKNSASNAGRAVVRNSALVGNAVTGISGVGGGAILVTGDAALAAGGTPADGIASLTLLNTTVSGNTANADIGMPGGGVALSTASVQIISSTFAANHAGASGADIHQGTLANTALAIRNSIVAAGTVDAPAVPARDRDIYQPGGAADPSAGGNVIEQPSTASCNAADRCQPPLLLALAQNGGTTSNHAPGAGSPAIDFIAPASCTNDVGAPLLFDQRGGAFPRQVNGNFCDAGAFEAQAPDLAITKTHGGNLVQGQAATFTITVTNVGTAPSSGTVAVVDVLPAGLTATAMSGTGWTCSLATLTCTRSDALTPAASYPPITLSASVAANAPTAVTNTATVSASGDLNPANDAASDVAIVGQLADLTVALSHSGTFSQGQTGATFTITVTNSGSGTTSAPVSVVDTLPAGLTATGLTGAGWTCTLATLTCTRPDALAAGASYPSIVLTVDVAPSAPASVTDSATVSGGGEINVGNDTATDVAAITQVPVLFISKTHQGNLSPGQTGALYTIVVTNGGGAPTAGAVTVTDTLPAGLTATAISGTGWTCTLVPLGCTRSDALAPGASYPPITLTVDVAQNASGTLTNVAAVDGGGATPGSTNAASDVAQVSGGAAVAIPTLSRTLLVVLAILLMVAARLQIRRAAMRRPASRRVR